MGLFYSPATGGFYDTAVHATVPVDAVAITKAVHTALLAGQASGKVITYDAVQGKPVALAPPEPLISDRRAQGLAAVRLEAGARIEALVPLWKQSNDNAVLGELAWRDAASLTTDQVEQLAEARMRRAAIDEIRDASNELEAAISTMTVAQLKTLDVTAAPLWPPAPLVQV